MPVSSTQLREVMGDFATGVTIVTARDASGQPTGFAANSVTSVSLDPPLVLVCVGKQRYAHGVLAASDSFAINILAEGHEPVARRFASPVADRFAELKLVDGPRGTPLLAEALGGIECERTAIYDGGDHSIFLGHVHHTWRTAGNPLLFFRGAFLHLGEDRDQAAAAERLGAEWWLVTAPW